MGDLRGHFSQRAETFGLGQLSAQYARLALQAGGAFDVAIECIDDLVQIFFAKPVEPLTLLEGAVGREREFQPQEIALPASERTAWFMPWRFLL